MSVLDPFEVLEVEVWPLPDFQNTPRSDQDARTHLDALEALVYREAVARSRFKSVLNEKNPPRSELQIELPESVRAKVVSDEVRGLRSHPDVRIARRAFIIAKLSQVISERKVQGGLRRVLVTQAERLQWLATERYQALGGAGSVPSDDANAPENSSDE